MLSVRRALVPIAFAALALIAAGCGVEAGDEASSSGGGKSSGGGTASTTVPSTDQEDLSPQEQQARDSMVDTYQSMGLEEQDAECLADGMMGIIGEGSSATEAPDVMDIINECDISMDTLSKLGQDAGGDGTLEDGMRYGLESSFKNQGLSEEQASCLADAFIEEFGTDSTAMNDIEQLRPLMEGCDVSITDFGN
jgi:hypothetical protein